MTPVYLGRLQTRLFVLAFVGGLWTAIITAFLPGTGSLTSKWQATFTVLAVIAVLGVAWDALYYFLQQFRWEKDWPIGFGLVTGVNEGVAAWLILRAGDAPGHPSINGAAFVIHFTSVWLVTWLFTIGPMRILFPRWRFQGGRLM